MSEIENGPIDTGPGLFGADPAMSGGLAAGYRVLARKYRPATFDDLIGQEAMVRTVSNAFETGRIPQAWILTGVRGVGKTTTARILARGLNYEPGGPTIHMPGLGAHCRAIMESRHVDVLEMDAASHNGVENMREITDAARYSPVSARFKVYIMDEVHMLSTGAFNALLKTLEEPPEHVKFIFATTEIRKVPVTVLSRCQRFDLRRVEAGTLVAHLQRIAAAEGLTAEPEALTLIARAAEGSVRDSLSLFDQAIAHSGGAVTAEDVRGMLGLADRGRILDLFETLMRADIAGALAQLRDLHDAGADPAVVVGDLAEATHLVTRIKVVPSAADDPALTPVERDRGRALATALSMRVLSRAWQMLFKGLGEVKEAAKPLQATEMLLVRIAYAADLPTPDELIRSLTEGGEGAAPAPRPPAGPGAGPRAFADPAPVRMAAGDRPAVASAPAPAAPPARMLARFEDVVALARAERDILLATALERDVRLVRFEDGVLEFAPVPGASPGLAADIGRKLQAWTGRRWMVAVSKDEGRPTLREDAEAREAERMRGVRAHPLVQAVLQRFPGAEIVGVRLRDDEPAPEPAPDSDEENAADA